MTKITDGSNRLSLLAAVLIMVAAGVAGCGRTTVTQAQLGISATAASGLTIHNNGGTKIALKNETITVKKEISDKVVDGINAVPLYGGTPEFQDAPVIETLGPGQKIQHVWKEPLRLGEVLVITIQDAPSGKVIVSAKIPAR